MPTSSPSTELAQQHPSDFSILIRQSEPNVVEKSNAALEAALQKESDERREERFYWICACILLLDLATFPHLGFVAVICVFLIELLVFAGLARKYADENIAIAVDRIIASVCDKFTWK
ncbi:hypothetical protein [Tardiphaga sp. 367_B4_N1_1]|uniref:hypothetical protein n=1 Tax=Tardiphaga sp. 367_B4_N1_1 TaxID=3240777 RepID=UPI003F28D61A